MFIIYRESSNGRREYFTGKITCVKGERVPVMTRNMDMKKYPDPKTVLKAKKALEAKCHMAFEVCTTKRYLRDRGILW